LHGHEGVAVAPLLATTHHLPLDSKGAAGTLPVPDSHGSISK
jgi:hypothetical protein